MPGKPGGGLNGVSADKMPAATLTVPFLNTTIDSSLTTAVPDNLYTGEFPYPSYLNYPGSKVNIRGKIESMNSFPGHKARNWGGESLKK